MLQTGEEVTYHPAPLLRRSGFPQRKDVATDGDFPPLARFGVLAEAVVRVHDQNAVGSQSIHLAVLHPPLGCLLLHTARQFTFTQLALEGTQSLFLQGNRVMDTPRKMFLEESKPAA